MPRSGAPSTPVLPFRRNGPPRNRRRRSGRRSRCPDPGPRRFRTPVPGPGRDRRSPRRGPDPPRRRTPCPSRFPLRLGVLRGSGGDHDGGRANHPVVQHEAPPEDGNDLAVRLSRLRRHPLHRVVQARVERRAFGLDLHQTLARQGLDEAALDQPDPLPQRLHPRPSPPGPSGRPFPPGPRLCLRQRSRLYSRRYSGLGALPRPRAPGRRGPAGGSGRHRRPRGSGTRRAPPGRAVGHSPDPPGRGAPDPWRPRTRGAGLRSAPEAPRFRPNPLSDLLSDRLSNPAPIRRRSQFREALPRPAVPGLRCGGISHRIVREKPVRLPRGLSELLREGFGKRESHHLDRGRLPARPGRDLPEARGPDRRFGARPPPRWSVAGPRPGNRAVLQEGRPFPALRARHQLPASTVISCLLATARHGRRAGESPGAAPAPAGGSRRTNAARPLRMAFITRAYALRTPGAARFPGGEGIGQLVRQMEEGASSGRPAHPGDVEPAEGREVGGGGRRLAVPETQGRPRPAVEPQRGRGSVRRLGRAVARPGACSTRPRRLLRDERGPGTPGPTASSPFGAPNSGDARRRRRLAAKRNQWISSSSGR